MEQNFDKNAISKAQQLANSDAGRELAGKLQQIDPALMQQLQNQLAAGDFTQISKTLGPLLASKDIQNLLRQLGG